MEIYISAHIKVPILSADIEFSKDIGMSSTDVVRIWGDSLTSGIDKKKSPIWSARGV
jgi:hypothetical protein